MHDGSEDERELPLLQGLPEACGLLDVRGASQVLDGVPAHRVKPSRVHDFVVEAERFSAVEHGVILGGREVVWRVEAAEASSANSSIGNAISVSAKLVDCVRCVLVGGQFRVEVVIWTNSIFDALCMEQGLLGVAVAPLLYTWLAWRELFATHGA